MRAVVQRCINASVSVDGEVVSSIGTGLMVLVGIGVDDTPSDSTYIIKKLLSIRLFDGPVPGNAVSSGVTEPTSAQNPETMSVSRIREGGGQMWRSSIVDIAGEILCVSQFTLMARTEKGSKPDFHQAMGSAASKAFYESFLSELRKTYAPDRIKDGRFGAMMQVSLTNDGPVTITLDSKNPKNAAPANGKGSETSGGKKGKSGHSTPKVMTEGENAESASGLGSAAEAATGGAR